MGCNCKNKQQQAQKITKEREKNVEMVVDVTLEEINIIENMIPDMNANNEKRLYVTAFFVTHFGDAIINYCDQVCQKRLKDRLKKLKKVI